VTRVDRQGAGFLGLYLSRHGLSSSVLLAVMIMVRAIHLRSVLVSKHHRIIRGAVQLRGDDVLHEANGVVRYAVHLPIETPATRT